MIEVKNLAIIKNTKEENVRTSANRSTAKWSTYVIIENKTCN
jgi:hypothetical protein